MSFSFKKYCFLLAVKIFTATGCSFTMPFQTIPYLKIENLAQAKHDQSWNSLSFANYWNRLQVVDVVEIRGVPGSGWSQRRSFGLSFRLHATRHEKNHRDNKQHNRSRYETDPHGGISKHRVVNIVRLRRRVNNRRGLRRNDGQIVVAQISVAAAENNRALLPVTDALRLIAFLPVLPTSLWRQIGGSILLNVPRGEAILEGVDACCLPWLMDLKGNDLKFAWIENLNNFLTSVELWSMPQVSSSSSLSLASSWYSASPEGFSFAAILFLLNSMHILRVGDAAEKMKKNENRMRKKIPLIFRHF